MHTHLGAPLKTKRGEYRVVTGKLSQFTFSHLPQLFNASWLPLHWAVARDAPSVGVVKLLLREYPESVLVCDQEGLSPLDR